MYSFPAALDAAYMSNNAKKVASIESFSDAMVLGELIIRAAKRCERKLRFKRPLCMTREQQEAISAAIASGYNVQVMTTDIVITW
jgi:hypothetical protein